MNQSALQFKMGVIRFANMFIGVIITILLLTCQKSDKESQPEFEEIPRAFPVMASLDEASGIASSKNHAGFLWVQEDGGAPSEIILLKNDGTFTKSIFIQGATNKDWEDMALSKGPDASLEYIYLADFGDNNHVRSDYVIYRIPEPAITVDTVRTYDRIRFAYPSGSHNAEAILVDPLSRDIYIITKSDDSAHIYKIPYPQDVSAVNNTQLVGKLAFGGVTGAAVSTDGREIIIKTYPAVSYFTRKTGESIEQALQSSSASLRYQLEAQGEAVCFASDNSGFYTISEKAFTAVVNLNFYKRK